MRTLLTFSLAVFVAGALQAQEFNCSISVVAPQVQSTPKRVFESMERAIKETMNNRRWTDFNYTPEERIDLSLLLTITEQDGDRFKAKLQVIYSRPAYNADYNSPVVDIVDNDVQFSYLENTQVEFSPDRFQNNLSSVLGFYAYFVLGLDGDTYSLLGGTDFYKLAQQVVNNASNAAESGWKAFENNKNRYWLVDNQLQAVFRPFRECLYNYHRFGLDLLSTDPAQAQKNIAEAIDKLKTVHQAKPSSYNLQVFFNAKADELVNIFRPVAPADKTKVFNTLQIIDPGNISKYQNMMKGS